MATTPRKTLPVDDRRAMAFVARVIGGANPLDAVGPPNLPYLRASALAKAVRETMACRYLARPDIRKAISRVALIRGNTDAVRLILQWEILEGSTRDARVAKTRMEMLTGRMAAASSRPARPGAGTVEAAQDGPTRHRGRTLGLPVPESTPRDGDREDMPDPADPDDAEAPPLGGASSTFPVQTTPRVRVDRSSPEDVGETDEDGGGE